MPQKRTVSIDFHVLVFQKQAVKPREKMWLYGVNVAAV
jgi:hypothetical protein